MFTNRGISVSKSVNWRIIFTNEAYFRLSDSVNKQSCRVWAESDPQETQNMSVVNVDIRWTVSSGHVDVNRQTHRKWIIRCLLFRDLAIFNYTHQFLSWGTEAKESLGSYGSICVSESYEIGLIEFTPASRAVEKIWPVLYSRYT